MQISVIIPLEQAEAPSPALRKALGPLAEKSPDTEFLFVHHGSGGGGPVAAGPQLPRSRVLAENRKGLAEALNRGLAEAKGELILLLDASAQPVAGWAPAMALALADHDLAVGETLSLPPRRGSPHGQLAARLFAGHSRRAAHAQGHALPWGPAGNLGFRRGLLEKVGLFSAEAGGACDIDWCWRALLKGARITFAEKAVVRQTRENDRMALLRQFERFGLGEAWLHRTYGFLLSPEDRAPDPLHAAVEAFARLRHHSQAAKAKALAPALDEVATAFACGVRVGYERPHRECPLEREAPREAVSWWSGGKTMSVFVPGKGLAQLEGKPLRLWQALRGQAGEEEAVQLCMRLFRIQRKAAVREVHEFRASLQP